MKKLTVSEVSEATELLMMAQNYQSQIDIIAGKITRLLGGVKDDFTHETVDQAILNDESIDWVVQEVKEWEKYYKDYKICGAKNN
jgi:hypothetical protein